MLMVLFEVIDKNGGKLYYIDDCGWDYENFDDYCYNNVLFDGGMIYVLKNFVGIVVFDSKGIFDVDYFSVYIIIMG